MAAKIGGIYADMDLKTAKFENALTKLQGKVDSNTRRMNRAFKKTTSATNILKKALVPLAAALGAASFARATKEALLFADSTIKMATRVGISTDALQELRHAASLSGLKFIEIDAALSRFNKRIGVFQATGSGSAKRAFETLGISNDVLTGKIGTTEEAFDIILEKLKELPNDAQRAGAAAGLFGDLAGPRMMLLLNQGSQGIAKMRQEARDLGLVIDQSMLQKSEEANDALDRVGRTLKTSLRVALVQLAPHIAEIGNAFAHQIPKVAKFIGAMMTASRRFLEIIGLVKKSTNRQSADAHEDLLEAQRQLQNLQKMDPRATGKNEKSFDSTDKEIVRQISLAQAKVESLFQTHKTLMNALADERAHEIKIKLKYEDADLPNDKPMKGFLSSEADKKTQDILDRREEVLLAMNQEAKKAADIALVELQHRNSSAAVRERELQAVHQKYNLEKEMITLQPMEIERLEAMRDIEMERKQTLDLAILAEEDRKRAMEEQAEVQRKANEAIKEGLQSMQDGITGLIDGTKTWQDALKGVLKTVINIVAKMGETQSGAFSFGKLASGLGSLFGGGLSQSALVNAGNAAAVTGAMKMHSGGVVGQSGGGIMAPGLRPDERLIVGQTGERVLPRGQSGGQNVVINQTINITTGIQQTVRAEVLSLAPQIAAQAKAAVLDAKKRGGGFSAAFA
jgi:hypothetical protein